MAIQIIPAIDIIDKKVVRLERGSFEKETVYSTDPVAIAKKWRSMGAKLLHVVDLDAAEEGRPVNTDVISKIIETVGVDIELGGGLRTEEDIEHALKMGASFTVIGTSAVRDEEFCKDIVQKFGGNVVFALDVKDGKIAISGWKEISRKGIKEYIRDLEDFGAERIIYTDISRDGMMIGPNLEALKKILESTSLDVTVSGGISSVNDIKTLKNLGIPNLKSVIIGKALYEGKIDLAEAINAG